MVGQGRSYRHAVLKAAGDVSFRPIGPAVPLPISSRFGGTLPSRSAFTTPSSPSPSLSPRTPKKQTYISSSVGSRHAIANSIGPRDLLLQLENTYLQLCFPFFLIRILGS